ncbi:MULTISPECIES: LamG domain-containing protein [unclassified Acinetobacter]|uniref:LamG domain-containing protein n=3 Tax=Acinetobacter TaxID=469 RepID=UPI00051BA0C2|nr:MULTISPECIES: LamG domain-containing protein [unclassified Acinetobacter]
MSGVRLEWAQFGDFDSFDVIRSDTSLASVADIDLPSPIATNLKTMYYVDTTVAEDSTYYYKVRAWRDGVSMVSSEIRCIANIDQYIEFVVSRSNMITSPITDLRAHTFANVGAVSVIDDTDAIDGKAVSLNNSYISTAYSEDFRFDSDFTVEIRFKYSSHQNYSGIICCGQSIGNWRGWNIIFNNTSNVVLVEINKELSVVSTTALLTNTYYHIALSRSGTTLRLFVNGILEATATYSGVIDATATNSALLIGVEREGNLKTTGIFDYFRITKDLCRYTSNFTPPSKI